MPAELLSRTSSKRKRDEKPALEATDSKRQYKAPGDAHSDSRRILSKLFNAIETTLTASLTSSSSFHSIQQAVRNTARCDFEWTHLAQIVGVWKDAYQFESAMTLHNNKRVPSLILSRPTSAAGLTERTGSPPLDRRKEFEARLADWHGETWELPALVTTTLLPLDRAKIESIRTPSSSSPVRLSPSSSDLSDGKSRQTALLERVRQKKAAAAAAAATLTGTSGENAMLVSLLPAAVKTIRALLLSRSKRVLGMRELADNVVTSLAARSLSRDEAEQLIRLVSSRHPTWCKVGGVGDVVVVRFFGIAP